MKKSEEDSQLYKLNYKRNKFFSSLFFTIGIVFVTAVFALTSLWVTRSSRSSTSNAVNRVSEFFIEEFAHQRVLSISEEIRQNYSYIENALSQISEHDLESKENLRNYLRTIRMLYDIDTFSFVDENNIIYTSFSTSAVSSSFYFMKDEIKEPSLNTVNLYGAEKQLILSVPVEGISFKGAKIKLCFVKINIDRIVESTAFHSENTETYCGLYYKNGQNLTNHSFGKIDENTNLLSLIKRSKLYDGSKVENVLSDFNNQVFGNVHLDLEGDDAFLYYIPVPQTKWMLTILVYDNVISDHLHKISDSILLRNRIQILITIFTLVILFISMFVIGRRNVNLRLKIEKNAADQIRNAYEKLNEEHEAMYIIHGVLKSGPWSMDFDENAKITACHWSDGFRKLLGYSSVEDFPDTIESWTNILHQDDKERVMKAYWAAVNDYSGSTIYDIEYRLLTKDRGWRWYHAAGNLTRREDGSPISYIGLFTDVDEKKSTEAALENQLYIFEALGRGYKNIFKVDPKKGLAEVLKLEGYVTEGVDKDHPKLMPYEKIIQNYIKNRVYSEDQSYLREAMSIQTVEKKLSKSQEYVSSYRVLDNGEIHFYQFKYMLLEDGMIIVGFNNIDDIVNAARERETLKTLSETDQMTGLYNRGSGEGKVTQALLMGQGGLFCLLDIDKFKYFNDNFGHESGDKVIISVARALKSAFREEDTVFRLGGDEFAAYASYVRSQEEGEKILKRFTEKLAKIDIPEIKSTPITASIGATVIRAGEASDFSEKYKLIDSGVYESKKIKGSAVTFKF